MTMKKEFDQLRRLYGKVPTNDATAEEVGARVEALTEQMDELLDSRGHELKQFSTNTPLTYRKRAGGQYIDAWTNLLNQNYEWLERKWKEDEIKRRSAEEWRELERAYIVKSNYTLWDFYDDFKTLIENKEADWNDYRVERKKWRQCKHRFCLEFFPIENGHIKSGDKYFTKRRVDARFCCQQCKVDETRSLLQYAKTKRIYDNPTFLPPAEIKRELELDITKQERAERHEVSYAENDELDALHTGEMKYTNFEAEAEQESQHRSYDNERRERYEAFIRGEGEPVFTVKIKKDEEITKEVENIGISHRLMIEGKSA